MSVYTSIQSDYVPSDFSDLFEHYYDYVRRLVMSRGILPQNSEDVAMTILVKFFEHDALSDFDPEYGGGRARFRTFLSGFVLTYLRHHLNRQRIVLGREIVDAESVTGATSPQEDTYDALMYADTVRTITDHLSRSEWGPRLSVNMTEFFRDVAARVALTGELDVAGIAEDYKVSGNTVRSWLKRLRVSIDEVLQ